MDWIHFWWPVCRGAELRSCRRLFQLAESPRSGRWQLVAQSDEMGRSAARHSCKWIAGGELVLFVNGGDLVPGGAGSRCRVRVTGVGAGMLDAEQPRSARRRRKPDGSRGGEVSACVCLSRGATRSGAARRCQQVRRSSCRDGQCHGPAQRGEVGGSITPTSGTWNNGLKTLKLRDFRAVKMFQTVRGWNKTFGTSGTGMGSDSNGREVGTRLDFDD